MFEENLQNFLKNIVVRHNINEFLSTLDSCDRLNQGGCRGERKALAF